jgi:hypothetical protein
MVVLGSVEPTADSGALDNRIAIPAPGESSGAVEWPLVYQRATAKLPLGVMASLKNKDLRKKGPIDSQTETKVL